MLHLVCHGLLDGGSRPEHMWVRAHGAHKCVLQTHEVQLEHLNATGMVEILDSTVHLI